MTSSPHLRLCNEQKSIGVRLAVFAFAFHVCIPNQWKTWLDPIVIVGKTFSDSEQGH